MDHLNKALFEIQFSAHGVNTEYETISNPNNSGPIVFQTRLVFGSPNKSKTNNVIINWC
jgi:hypothetical protein